MLFLQVKFDYTSLAMAVATDCSINDEFLFNNWDKMWMIIIVRDTSPALSGVGWGEESVVVGLPPQVPLSCPNK